MASPPESIEPVADVIVEPGVNGAGVKRRATRRGAVAALAERWGARWTIATVWERFGVAIAAYVGTRLLLVLVALLDVAFRHHSFTHEIANWDGGWYRALATDGYKHEVVRVPKWQTTTGFFPMYPMVVWLLSQPLLAFASHPASASAEVQAAIVAGFVISLLGGLAATLLVQRVAGGWWGESAGRRAAVLFCVFPGSVVFSMVYAEGIMIPLAIACILFLQQRRWVWAGLVAAVATATEPEAAVLIVVCAVSAGRELYRRGWREPEARRSLVAPLLAPAGLVGVIAFLWAWTGTPFAYTIAQHYGWDERFDPLALVHLGIRLAGQISFAHFNHPTINLNWPVGLIGAAILVVLLALMFRIRRTISLEAWIWTLGLSFLAVTSEWVPPNPRILITAFPAVIVPAYYLKRKGFAWLLVANAVLLIAMSAVTFVGVTLRP
jgi:Gpi18-like mannosyltransferase